MIIFIRSTDSLNDPRLQKYMDFVQSENIRYTVIAWNRDKQKVQKDHYIFFNKTAKYGSGMKNIRGLIMFNYFIFKTLIRLKREYRVIHACDFDTIFPAVLSKIILRKKLVYDIFDWYIDSRAITNKFFRKIIGCLERLSLKSADVTIICEEERSAQLNTKPRQLWIFPNIPAFTPVDLDQNPRHAEKTVVSYVGVLSPGRWLDKMIDFAKNNPDLIEFHIAGLGQLEPEIVESVKGASNISFYGRVPYAEGLKIMHNSDIILAIYEKTIPNHIFAAPNKFYEGLYLGRPILTTEGTLVGNKTITNQTGFAIGETSEDLQSFFSSKTLKSDLIKAGIRGKELWDAKYSTYVMDFMKNKYLNFVVSK